MFSPRGDDTRSTVTNDIVRGTSASTAPSPHHLLNAHTSPNDHDDRASTGDCAESNGYTREAISKTCDSGRQELDNRKNATEAGLHDADVCDSGKGLVWNYGEARQRGEVLPVEMKAFLNSDRARDVNRDDGRDAHNGDGDDCGRDAG